MDEILEKEFIAKAQKGDVGAFEEIMSEYERSIFGYVLRLTANREDAEDITQETFLKVYNHLNSYDASRPFKTWIYTIATRTVYDLFRKRKVHQELYIIDDEDIGFETIDETDAYKKIETAEELENALAKIKPTYRSILLLHYMQEFTYEEISEALNQPLGTVKTNLRRAKIALKQILEKDG